MKAIRIELEDSDYARLLKFKKIKGWTWFGLLNNGAQGYIFIEK